jgi:hypothetical protein
MAPGNEIVDRSIVDQYRYDGQMLSIVGLHSQGENIAEG